MNRPVLSEEEFRLFSEWLVAEYGLNFPPEKRDILRSRLEPRRAELGMETFEQLFFHLKFHPERETERQQLIPHLTNNESYFLRERAQLDILRDEVLPELQKRLRGEGRREVRILSAGCALGQEAYTLAMIAKESKLFPPPWKVRITGMDLDPRALERARRGVFTEHALRGVEPEIRTRYFEDEDGQWVLSPAIRTMVEFAQGNLLNADWLRPLGQQDVVFCRNVLIYFDRGGIGRAVEHLHQALVPGGYLFLGHAESLSRISTPFCAQRRAGAVFYRRIDAGIEMDCR